jgi:hypothetical protein
MSVSAITAFTASLAQLLKRRYELAPAPDVASASVEAVGMSDFKKLDGAQTRISLLLVRVSHNEHLRNRPLSTLPAGKLPPLAVNLHLLFTVWADKADKEHLLLAWLLRELHRLPVLGGAALGAPFSALDAIQLTPEELSLDDLSKLWQVLAPPLRPSLGYIARHVALDLEARAPAPPVLATRHVLVDPPPRDDVTADLEAPR